MSAGELPMVSRREVFALALGGRMAPGLPPVHRGARADRSAILMWHDVVTGKKDVWFDITVSELTQQFDAIRKAGLTPIRLDRLADNLDQGKPVPPGSVVLTFDDNTLGLYRHLFPLLQARRWPAAFFVHTNYVGVRTGKDHCTWEQLQEMERSGWVQAYPHTASHPPDLRRLSDEQVRKELVGPLDLMNRKLGQADRRFFAYSEGHFDERVARLVQAAGYRLAITENWGFAQQSPNLMMVHRYSMHRRPEQAVRDSRREMLRRKDRGR